MVGVIETSSRAQARCDNIGILSLILSMAPYDDWNRIDEEEDAELQDTSVSVDG
jgi:hypothetical protein